MNVEQDNRLRPSYALCWCVVLIGLPVTYAVVRYHLCGEVAWSHFPLFVLNKAISLAAVLFIAMSYLVGKAFKVSGGDPAGTLALVRYCGFMGFSLAAIHGLMAMLLLSPGYYPAFFDASGRLNLTGELSMLFGVLSFWCLLITAVSSLRSISDAFGAVRWKRAQRMGYSCLALVGGHVLTMGMSGWFKPGSWHGSLPPISLLAFIAALIPLFVKLLRRL